MNYSESIDYLQKLSYSGIRLGLENTRKILQHFGNPQFKTPTVHIAGTNGKGSTAAILESILRTSRCCVGLYTSPHFLDIRERIQVNRHWIEKDIFSDLATIVRKTSEDLGVFMTYFEFCTVIAFLYFAEKKVDWSVIEVGLGGRLDATNLCQAGISILTSISKDHEKILGRDIKQIAFEKASIINENGIVIADSMDDKSAEVILKMSRDQKALLFEFGKDFFVEQTCLDSAGQIISFESPKLNLDNLYLPLIGRHQAHNAALAIAASLELRVFGIEVNSEDIRIGLANTSWKGRLEQVSAKPVILLDGAHNPDSAKKMTLAIREHFDAEKLIFIIGVMKDKSIEKIANIISMVADRIILTGLKEDRAEDPKKLCELFKKYHKHIETYNEISGAIDFAKKLAGARDLICITGSFYTVADAKRHLDYEEYT